jgi:glycosyltransferase involved in cell wall biosynthesis
MSTIWLDVSTVLSWQRPAVGIVRTEAACASYCLQWQGLDAIDVRFCRFDSATGYGEVSAADVGVALNRIQGTPKALGTSPTKVIVSPVQTVPVVSLEQRAKALALRLIALLPAKFQASAFNFAMRRKDVLGAASRGFKELKHALKLFLVPKIEQASTFKPRLTNENVASRPLGPFGAGDVYVSMGLDWDQKDLVYLHKIKRAVGFKVVLFCYDVIPVKLPHLCVGDVAASFAHYFANVAWCADQVLCISECTKRDLQSLLGELGTPIPCLSVITLGGELAGAAANAPSFETADDVSQVLGERFILFVSTIERRKNHEVIYRAYVRLIDEGATNLPLFVFVGMQGWGVNDLMADLRYDPRITNLIRVLNHVTDTDLTLLYRQSLFTVFPSLYEGWGLPVAESLTAGKFCLASKAASIPEVGGDLIEYIDPWDVPLWSQRLRWYFDHPEELAERENQIQQRYAPVTWSGCASSIMAHAVKHLIKSTV